MELSGIGIDKMELSDPYITQLCLVCIHSSPLTFPSRTPTCPHIWSFDNFVPSPRIISLLLHYTFYIKHESWMHFPMPYGGLQKLCIYNILITHFYQPLLLQFYVAMYSLWGEGGWPMSLSLRVPSKAEKWLCRDSKMVLDWSLIQCFIHVCWGATIHSFILLN